MRAASDVYTGEAGAGIYEPRGEGLFECVAYKSPEKWEELAAEYGRP